MDPHSPSTTRTAGTSFSRTCFNGVNTLIGLGMLSIPFALSQGGWLSLILLFTIAMVCYYTGLLLQRCMDSNSLVKTYTDVGELAFGYKGRLIVATFMYLELYLAAIEFLILEGDNLDKLFPNTNFHLARLKIGGKQGFVVLATLVVLPTTWLRSMGVLAYVSFGGVLSSLILLVSVIWTGAAAGDGRVGFHERGELVNWSGIATAASLYTFCYSGHSVFPTVYTSMKDRTMFPSVLLVCFCLSSIIYALMAVLGYLMFGQGTMSQITLNLPAGHLTSKLAIYTTVVTPLTKYALLITPIANAIEDCFSVYKCRFISLVIRTLLVLSSLVIALTVPFFGYVVALTGSFLSSNATMLLPCACYLKIFKDGRRFGFELVVMIGIMALGALIAVLGTYSSIKEIVHNF